MNTEPSPGAPQSSNQLGWVTLLACSAAYFVGNLTGWMTPQIVAGLQRDYALSTTLASLVPTLEMLVIGIASIYIGARAAWNHPRRWVVIGVVTVLIVNAVSTHVPTIESWFVLRMIAGVAAAVGLSLSTVILAQFADPDRAFALANVVNNVLGAALVASFPLLSPTHAIGLAYLPFSTAFAVLLVLPLICLLPPQFRTSTPEPLTSSATSSMADRTSQWPTPIILALTVTTVLIAVSSFAHYTFAITFGLRMGLKEPTINVILGAAGLISILGAVGAAVFTRRLGRRWPALCMASLGLIANLLVVWGSTPQAFVFGVVVNFATMYYLLPLLLGYAASLTPDGRGSATVMGAFVTACGVAPAVGGILLDRFGIDSFTVMAVLAFIVCVIQFLVTDDAASPAGEYAQ